MDRKRNTGTEHTAVHSRMHHGLIFLLVLLLGGCAANPVKEKHDSSGYDGLYGGSDELKRTHKAGKSADTADAAIALGDQSLQKGEYDQAVYHYIQALDLNGGDATTLNKIGDIQVATENYEIAAQAYQKSINLEADNQHALEGLGLIQLRNRQYEQARDNLSAALELDPNLWRAHNALGTMADLQGDYSAAKVHYRSALAINPSSVQLINNYGYSYYLSGEWDAAMGQFRTAININPEFERAWYNVGLVYARQGRLDDALGAFDNVMKRPQAYNDIGYICMLDGNYSAAEIYFRKAVRSSSSFYKKAHDNMDKMKRLRAQRADMATSSQGGFHAGTAVTQDDGMVVPLQGSQDLSSTGNRMAKASSGNRITNNRQKSEAGSIRAPEDSGRIITSRARDATGESLDSSVSSNSPAASPNSSPIVPPSVNSKPSHSTVSTSAVSNDNTGHSPSDSESARHPNGIAGIADSDYAGDHAETITPEKTADKSHSASGSKSGNEPGIPAGTGVPETVIPAGDTQAPSVSSQTEGASQDAVMMADNGPVEDRPKDGERAGSTDVLQIASTRDPVTEPVKPSGTTEVKDDGPGENVNLTAASARPLEHSAGTDGLPGSGADSARPEAGDSADTPDTDSSMNSGNTPGRIAAMGGSSVTGSAVAGSREEQKERYEKALSMLRKGEYTRAAEAFEKCLADYPQGSYADDATYSLGQAYYFLQDFDQAMAMFSKLIDVYPQSPMQASAHFFVGNLHYQNQEWDTAREKLYRVVADYPESIPAQLAENRLQDMRQNGH